MNSKKRANVLYDYFKIHFEGKVSFGEFLEGTGHVIERYELPEPGEILEDWIPTIEPDMPKINSTDSRWHFTKVPEDVCPRGYIGLHEDRGYEEDEIPYTQYFIRKEEK